MVKISLITIYLILCCISCNTTKHKEISHNTELCMNTSAIVPESVHFSARFKMLWNDLSKETKHFENIDSYIPSKDIINKHQIKLQNGQYIFKGYLHTTPLFDKHGLEKSGIQITSYNDSLNVFSCPLNKIVTIANYPEITSIETSRPIFKR